MVKNEGNTKRILAIGAHPDDVELGCGGTLAKYAKEGADIFVLFLTKGEMLSNNNGVDRVQESMRALSVLGIQHFEFGNLRDTKIYEELQKAISVIENFCQKLNPQRVYTMSESDSHQDHWATYMATTAACRNVSQLLCYETPSTSSSFTPNIFENLTTFLELKVEAIMNHNTQQKKPYMSRDAIVIRAKFRGLQTNVEAAEAFEAYRLIL